MAVFLLYTFTRICQRFCELLSRTLFTLWETQSLKSRLSSNLIKFRILIEKKKTKKNDLVQEWSRVPNGSIQSTELVCRALVFACPSAKPLSTWQGITRTVFFVLFNCQVIWVLKLPVWKTSIHPGHGWMFKHVKWILQPTTSRVMGEVTSFFAWISRENCWF